MDAGCYDGGNPGIPGDITGTVRRVVVVGAGIAGLATANALIHAGVECVVLEARDRVGGRLHTVDVAGWPVDMGGSLIHFPAGNPLSALADQAGIGGVLVTRSGSWWPLTVPSVTVPSAAG